MELASLINGIVVFLLTLVAIALAMKSFQRRSVQLGDEPTLPRYFTPRGLYWLGIGVYGLLIGGFFYLMINEWLPLKPLIEIIVKNLKTGNTAGLFTSLDGGNLVPLILAALFLFVIGWDSKFNPLLILRDTVFDIFSIPRKALEVYHVLRSSRLSEIDPEERDKIVSRLLVESVDAGDFDMASNTVEYRWARCCVLFNEIQAYANQPSFQRFFAEPSLKWGDICLSFNKQSEQVAVWRAAPPHYTKTLRLLDDLDRLDQLLSRFLACIILVGSASEEEIWNTVQRLGGDANRVKLKHTYKYLLTFSVAILLAVIVGREFSTFLLNAFVYPDDPQQYFDFDTVRWIIYAVPMYVFPISVVFVSRIYGFRMGTVDQSRHYGFYALMMLIGFLVSTSVSALILGLWNAEDAAFDFFESFRQSTRWGILPAMVSGFVAYQMDTPADEFEPKSEMIASAFIRFLWAGLIALIIMLYATDDLAQIDPKLRFTVVITTVFLVGFLAAVTRFKLVPANGD